MPDAAAPARLSARSERINLVLVSMVGAGVLAFCVYRALNGELGVTLRDGSSVLIRGWAAWVFCLVPVLALGAAIAHIKHRAGRLSNKALLAVLLGSVIAMFAVILATVPGPLNPFGITQ